MFLIKKGVFLMTNILKKYKNYMSGLNTFLNMPRALTTKQSNILCKKIIAKEGINGMLEKLETISEYRYNYKKAKILLYAETERKNEMSIAIIDKQNNVRDCLTTESPFMIIEFLAKHQNEIDSIFLESYFIMRDFILDI